MSDLAALAQAAIPGPWHDGDPRRLAIKVGSENDPQSAADHEGIHAVYEFVCACTPDAVLALIRERDEARAELAAVDAWDRTKAGFDPAEVWDELQAARAELQALRDRITAKAAEWQHVITYRDFSGELLALLPTPPAEGGT